MAPAEEVLSLRSSDGFALHAVARFAAPGAPAVVFAHGMSVDLDGEGIFVLAYNALADLGFSVLRFDFRAHGKSQGESQRDFLVSGELLDLEAALGALRAHGCGALGLAGASFGGSLAALYAGMRPGELQAVLLANPLLDFAGILRPSLEWTRTVYNDIEAELQAKGYVDFKAEWSTLKMSRRFFEEMAVYSPIQSLRYYQGPLLAIHGDRDSMVSLPATQAAFEALDHPGKRFEVIPGAGHGFHEAAYEPQVAAMVTDFFQRHLGR
jgi:pimeloyl-ACP methyl ester carboxylesterase